MTEADQRLTGKEWFKENQAKDIEDLTLDDLPKEDGEDEEDAVAAMAKYEEAKEGEDNDEEGKGALYDKNLFAEELGDLDDDVDFD